MFSLRSILKIDYYSVILEFIFLQTNGKDLMRKLLVFLQLKDPTVIQLMTLT